MVTCTVVAVWSHALWFPCSKEECKKALVEAQGLILFGNKIKLTAMPRDGEYCWHAGILWEYCKAIKSVEKMWLGEQTESFQM